MRRLLLGLVFFFLLSIGFAQSFEGKYSLLPQSNSIYTDMEITSDTILLKNNELSSIILWEVVPDINLIIISGLGYYYEFKGDLLILSPAFEQADIIYARRKSNGV